MYNIYFKINLEAREMVLALRMLDVFFYRGPRLIFEHPHDGLQPSITLFPGYLMLTFDV